MLTNFQNLWKICNKVVREHAKEIAQF